jgi:hypothetical protein
MVRVSAAQAAIRFAQKTTRQWVLVPFARARVMLGRSPKIDV